MIGRLALIVAALALAGCDRAAEPDRADAGGEILEGSVSDAMLPLDSVRSQPPLAAPSAAAGGGPSPGRTGAAGSDDDADGESEAEPAPAETPETTPDEAPPTP